MAGKEASTDGTTSQKGEAARARAEVGGVGSSVDPVPDLWFGELAEERSDATCSAGVKRREGGGDGPATAGLQAPDKLRQLQVTLYRPASNRDPYMELGKPDAGKPPVRFDEGREADGHWLRPLNPSLPAYSTQFGCLLLYSHQLFVACGAGAPATCSHADRGVIEAAGELAQLPQLEPTVPARQP